jgi:hypothetical protein
VRGNRSRLGLLALLVLALGAIALPVSAQAAKVRVSAPGGPVPNATGGPGLATSVGVFTQTFNLKGKNVKKKQVQDVNLIVNSIGSLDVNDDLFGTLSSPNGANSEVIWPSQGSGMVNVKFDDQSDKQYCNPFSDIAPYCSYIQGATGSGGTASAAGFFTGSIGTVQYGTAAIGSSGFNPVFKGSNPKGTWRLAVYDTNDNPVAMPETAIMGTSTLEVQTGKKFAKE